MAWMLVSLHGPSFVMGLQVLPEITDAFLLSSGQAILSERWTRENLLYGENDGRLQSIHYACSLKYRRDGLLIRGFR